VASDVYVVFAEPVAFVKCTFFTACSHRCSQQRRETFGRVAIAAVACAPLRVASDVYVVFAEPVAFVKCTFFTDLFCSHLCSQQRRETFGCVALTAVACAPLRVAAAVGTEPTRDPVAPAAEKKRKHNYV